MSLPIASITTTFTITSITSVPATNGNVFSLLGQIDAANADSTVLVKVYCKTGEETFVEGSQYLVIGTPSAVNGLFSIDARLVIMSDLSIPADITIGGRLGSDCQTRSFDKGSVINANLAVKSMKETSWFSVSIWGNQPAFMQKALVKGAAICVSGGLKFESYNNRQGMVTKKVSVQTRRVDLLSGMGTNAKTEAAAPLAAPAAVDADF